MSGTVAVSALLARFRSGGRAGWIAGIFLFLATAALFLISRGKWSDALIDSGNIWILPDSIARGDVLYRDVVWWFGPFTPYAHGLLFRLLGSSYSTLVFAGILGSLATLAALILAVRRVATRCESFLWAALALPALVFMPYSGGAILGMGYRMWHAGTFGLLAVTLAARLPEERRPRHATAAGALAALAGLCRTEWGLATLFAVVLAVFVGRRDRREAWRDELRVLLAYLVVFAGTFVVFAAVAGAAAFLRDAPVLLVNLPPEVHSRGAFEGLRGWRSGIWILLYSGAAWFGLYFLVEIVALRRYDPSLARRRLPLLAGVLLVFGVAGLRGAAGSSGLIWSAAPLVCGVAGLVGLRRIGEPRAPAMIGFGALGVLLSHRRPFFIEDAPYVGPPLLFALVCAAGLYGIAIDARNDPDARESIRRGLAFTLVLLTAIAFAARLSQYSSDDRSAIAGTGGLLSARPDLAREIERLVSTIRADSRESDALVVFPEGEVLNFLSGRRNPIRHKLYLPGYVTSANEEQIVRELQSAAPAAVVVWNRPRGEYGGGIFGRDYARQIGRWIEDNYARKSLLATGGAGPVARPELDYFVRRAAR